MILYFLYYDVEILPETLDHYLTRSIEKMFGFTTYLMKFCTSTGPIYNCCHLILLLFLCFFFVIFFIFLFLQNSTLIT